MTPTRYDLMLGYGGHLSPDRDGGYILYGDHTAAMAAAYRAGAEAREWLAVLQEYLTADGEHGDAILVGDLCKYLPPPPPTTSDDGETTP